MHHQVVVLDEEIGTAFEIQAISWKYISIVPTATCENFTLHLGYCSSDELGMSFEDNYISGTKTLVFSADPLVMSPGGDNWSTITLDSPFWYSGTDNLIIEVQWENQSIANSYYCGRWDSGQNRTLYQQNTPDNYLSVFVLHMLLEGTESLDQTTFGRIKIELGN